MGTFILRRLLQLLFVLWGGATLLFILFYLVGGNPAERMASGGGARNPDPQVVANLEARLGLDKSKPQQYVSYLSNIVRGDLGESFRTREPVVDIAKRRAPTSFRLAFWAVIIEATEPPLPGTTPRIKKVVVRGDRPDFSGLGIAEARDLADRSGIELLAIGTGLAVRQEDVGVGASGLPVLRVFFEPGR